MPRRALPLPTARGLLLTGAALAICGAAVILRGIVPGPAPVAAPALLSVPVAVPSRDVPAVALVVVPPAVAPPAAVPPATVPVVDPLAIDLARLAARIARERAAAAAAPVAPNRVMIVAAAPRPVPPAPGPRLTRPATLAALDLPDAAPRTIPPAPAPDLAVLRAVTAPPSAVPAILTARALFPPPARPGAATGDAVAEPAGPGLLASLFPRPRPDLPEEPARPTEPVLAAAPAAPRAAPAPEPAPAVAEPVLGPRVADAGACRRALARAIPGRKPGAAGGRAFLAGLGGLSGTDRDARIVAELAHGNLPPALRDLRPVRLSGTDAAGQPTEIVVCVMPDYLALGSDTDHVRVPLGLPAAREIAARFGMTLPTPRMVDAIWAQADVRLSPAPMPAGPQMSSTDYLLRHNATIEGQLGRKGGLVSGHKKDVVLASRMQNAPGRVAIYGWHQRSGQPIQPVSTVHGATYSDYSHGIRLVAGTAFVNGRAADLEDLLASPRYAAILNSDGPLSRPVIQLASR